MSASEHAEPDSQPSTTQAPEGAVAILLATDSPLVWEPLLGRALLAWAVAAFESANDVAQVMLVVSPDRTQVAEALSQSERWTKTRIASARDGWHEALLAGVGVVEGGELAGSATDQLVVVHEAARPLVTVDLIAATLAAARKSGASMAGEPVKETIKRVRDGRIVGTVPRNQLVRAQTPLVFSLRVLRATLATSSADAATPSPMALVSHVLATGAPVSFISSSPENLLVRTAADLAVAAALLQRRTSAR
ncbi:MAG TPA: 2-C-methyl-D-erythritol 4-phosphate cytidylyltransferase [Ktedonobacterales bacterium]